jgi:hypothetical protein
MTAPACCSSLFPIALAALDFMGDRNSNEIRAGFTVVPRGDITRRSKLGGLRNHII